MYVRTYQRVEDSFRVYEVLRVTIPPHRHSQILLETIKENKNKNKNKNKSKDKSKNKNKTRMIINRS